MSATWLMKRCDRCGDVGPVRPRERRCKRHRQTGFGKFRRTYYCWGKLVTVRGPAKRVSALRAAVAAVQKGLPANRPQAVAAAKLKDVRRRIKRTRTAIRQAETRLRRLLRREQDLAARAAMTDEQVLGEIAARAAGRWTA